MIMYTHDKETRDGIIAIPVAQVVADNMSADGEIIAIQPVDSEKLCRIWYIASSFDEWGFGDFDGQFTTEIPRLDVPAAFDLPEDVRYVLFGGYGRGDESTLLYRHFQDIIEQNRSQALRTRRQIIQYAYQEKLREAAQRGFDTNLITPQLEGGAYGYLDYGPVSHLNS